MADYSIKDLETLSGVKAHTIRIWEQRYNLLSPKRTDTNIRFYQDNDLKKLLNISLLNKNGVKISHIAEMNDDEILKKSLELTEIDGVPNAMLESLMHAMLEFDEIRFEKTLNQAIMKLGFENTFLDILLPFLQRIGTLWLSGVVNPAQEHFMSNLIKRKLYVAIDNRYVDKNESSKHFVIFLPEGENHELIPLFIEYILRTKNIHVTNLGPSLPLDALGAMVKKTAPHGIFTFLTIAQKKSNTQNFVDELYALCPNTEIYIGGAQMDQNAPKLPKNVYHVRSVDDMYNIQ